MEEITLWYRWNKDKWEYITYEMGWSQKKHYKQYNTPYRFAKEFAYILKGRIIYSCE